MQERRGAKTVRVPSAPEIQTDIDAVTRVLEKSDISGSGLGTIVGFTWVAEADGNLIAPDKQSYDPNGMFRVLGNGEFTAEQLKDLTEDERAALLQRLGRKASL